MITQKEVDDFNQKGFLVVENLLDEATLTNIRAEYASLMGTLYEGWWRDGKVEKSPENMSFWEKLEVAIQSELEWYQPFDISLPHSDISLDTPMHIGPAVFSMATHKNILDMVEQLIGPEITSNPIQHVRIKPPQNAVPKSENRAHIIATDWHQDMGVTMPEADQTEFVTVWLAITDATVENGCLQVASKHYDEMLPHCTKNQVGIADQFIPEESALPVPVKAGGAVIFHPFTPHSSLTNTTDGFRWSFDLRYNVTGQPTGRSQFPEFVARSKSNPDKELKDWQGWQEMWNDTRKRLSQSEHIPQHRWDSSSPYCA